MASQSIDKTTSKILIAVGSSNPSKIRAVQQALGQIMPTVLLELQGFGVESGVSDQPMHNEETKQGAKNRAKAAWDQFLSERNEEPDLAVGLEGGLDEEDNELVCMAWMALFGKRSIKVLNHTKASDCGDCSINGDDHIWGFAKTASFHLPPEITRLVKEGMELGDADDKVFSRVKSKHGSGTVGILTNNFIDRSKYYEHALLLAMIPWIRPDMYPST
mmetsp:Transcript_17678/g.26827  ORF Transcript_17678/g.26827 Transcript_17678/m.26827 type:complete len:218 (+) Transcript_17678:146-799(+)|eukprot:CAMPEP_0178900250 /NCGR_PEP_ID=MMETSP0786-20121207/3372_1 /TAXON_ID=186022 /ORGANISM="Thalassionema frauenfeldii, Strain CCMP 1798" /LENGTH=217 /DNA_ID=CAMNT_0020571239 /DNA_START=60 /DNA_END=713 /DNA_ORIENTATION=-